MITETIDHRQLNTGNDPRLEKAGTRRVSTILRRLFARTVEDEAANIRESIRRDNLRGLQADPHYIRGEYISDFERQQRRRHVLRPEAVEC